MEFHEKYQKGAKNMFLSKQTVTNKSMKGLRSFLGQSIFANHGQLPPNQLPGHPGMMLENTAPIRIGSLIVHIYFLIN